MSFFNPSTPGFQPKRKFRFVVDFQGFGVDTMYMVTKCGKPSFELTGPTEHRILNHTFKFPGIVKWNDIDMTLIDAVEPNVGSKFYNVLKNMGYTNPDSLENLHVGLTKTRAQSVIGTVRITQLDGGDVVPTIPGDGDPANPTQYATPAGVKLHEEWILKNAYLKSVKFGDLAYDSEDIVTIDVGITYDYAIYRTPGIEGEGYQVT